MRLFVLLSSIFAFYVFCLIGSSCAVSDSIKPGQCFAFYGKDQLNKVNKIGKYAFSYTTWNPKTLKYENEMMYPKENDVGIFLMDCPEELLQ